MARATCREARPSCASPRRVCPVTGRRGLVHAEVIRNRSPRLPPRRDVSMACSLTTCAVRRDKSARVGELRWGDALRNTLPGTVPRRRTSPQVSAHLATRRRGQTASVSGRFANPVLLPRVRMRAASLARARGGRLPSRCRPVGAGPTSTAAIPPHPGHRRPRRLRPGHHRRAAVVGLGRVAAVVAQRPGARRVQEPRDHREHDQGDHQQDAERHSIAQGLAREEPPRRSPVDRSR